MKSTWFQRYLLPGFIVQSAVIAGAYGSGKELEQFFLGHGPIGGLLGMTVTMMVFSMVLMAAYEFARKFRLFDYRSLEPGRGIVIVRMADGSSPILDSIQTTGRDFDQVQVVTA